MSIRLEGLSKRYGAGAAVDDLTLEVMDGELFVLLGPSGSGKSTVLRMIAGLVSPDAGCVRLHGRDVTGLPSQHRNVGMVFQNYSLFRHMTVGDNIEFGLAVRRVAGARRRARRDELLELIGLAGFADRYPRQLSGGQMQRVAVARALAFDPSVLLLDEPFGALDVRIRGQLRRSLKRIQRQLGVTTILVTHDQEEAFELADRIGVVDLGRLLEVGTPEELYRHPRTEFVARFLGSAALLAGQLQGERLELGELVLNATQSPWPAPAAGRPGSSASSRPVTVMLRPEDLELASDPARLRAPALGRVDVTAVEFRGGVTRVEVVLDPGTRVRAAEAGFGDPSVCLEVSMLPAQLAAEAIAPGMSAWVGVRGHHVLAPAAPRLHLTFHPGFTPALLAGAMRVLGHIEGIQVSVLAAAPSRDKLTERMAVASRLVPKRSGWTIAGAVVDDWVQAALDQVRDGGHDLMVTHADSAGVAERLARETEIPALVLKGDRPALGRALVCTAAGEPGKVDVLVAARVVLPLHARVTLLHVAPAASGDAGSPVDRHLALGAETLRALGIPCDTRVRCGDVLDEILAESREGDYDLIVVGGHLPAARRPFGGRDVAAQVAAAADRPVLVVRGPIL